MRKNYILTALFVFCGCVQAGVQEGVDAFNKSLFADARKELTLSAEQDDADSMVYMGEMLMRGQGGARDELKARDYITRAYEKGSIRATYTLGRMHVVGNLVVKDEAKGVDLVKLAAEKGYAPAQSVYGAWIANGSNGLVKNDAVALTWFKTAAEQKDELAMYWMGNFYENGKADVVKDNLVALDWYKKAAELKQVEAMVSAGKLYALGLGVSADGAEALRWLKKAVALGGNSAYLWIGHVYEFGRGGIEKNITLAYTWYSAAPSNTATNVMKPINDSKERIAKVLSPTEIQEAIKQSKTVVAQNSLNNIIATLTSNSNQVNFRKGVFGSGVVVSRSGDIVTNEHVIQGCGKIRIQPLNLDIKLISKDAKNDLALLRLENGNLPASKVRSGKTIRLGDELVAIGYPLRGLLSSGPVVTAGIVNALSGFNDDTSAFQMSATVQPGSSGGPIFDNNGLLVGIVRARLSGGALNPQNVNFGINQPTLTGFLDAHSVNYVASATSSKSLNVGDITALVQKSVVQIECY